MQKREIILISSIFITIFVFNIILPPQSDDIGAFFSALSKRDFLHSYFSWNGRIGEIFYTGIFASTIKTIWFDLLNSIAGVLAIFGFFYLIFLRIPQDRGDYFLFFTFCAMVINSNFAAIFLWGSGSLNYLWGIGLIIFFLIPYRIFWGRVFGENIEISRYIRIAFGVLFFFLSFFAGWASEHIGAMVVLVLTCSIIYAAISKIRLPWWYYVGYVCFIAGWIVLFCSPGSAKRAAIFIREGSFLPLIDIIHMSIIEKIKLINEVFCRYYYRGFAFFTYFLLWFYCWKMKVSVKNIVIFSLILPLSWVFAKHVSGLLVYLLFGFLIWQLAKQEKKLFLLFGLYCVWVAIGGVLIQLKGSLPWRAHFGDGLILATMVILMLREFYLANPKYQVKLQLGASLVLVFSVLGCFANWAYVGYNWSKIEEIIKTEKQKGNTHVIVPQELFTSFYRKDWDEPHVNETNWWVNQVYARYFGVESFDLK